MLTDIHLGYSRGTRENDHGVNQREQDIIDSAQLAVNNLVNAGVDAIVDLGDMAHTPAPKKRAVMALVNMIRNSDVPWYSANGNHTLQRTRSDIHLYDVLESLCSNFRGFVQPGLVRELGFYLIPYGTEVEALKNIPENTRYIGGHFACDDVPFPGEHVAVSDLPREIPTFLGHYHTRKGSVTVTREVQEIIPEISHLVEFIPGRTTISFDGPFYIGATDRLAWGEANNPTGVCLLDDTGMIRFVDHEARKWLDLQATAEGVMDVLRSGDFTGKIVRLSIEATGPEYNGLNIKEIRELARPALEFQIKREGSAETFSVADHADTQTYSLMEAWKNHVEYSKKQIKFHKRMLELGNQALSQAGVVDS
jgi:hypothetical protein